MPAYIARASKLALPEHHEHVRTARVGAKFNLNCRHFFELVKLSYVPEPAKFGKPKTCA